MGCLKRIAGVTRQYRVRNDFVRSNLKIRKDIVEKVELPQLGWLFWPRHKNEPELPHIHGHLWSREWMQKKRKTKEKVDRLGEEGLRSETIDGCRG